MSSALSGLRNHQTAIDVIGNDIANVSTVGYKQSSVVFSDVLSQTIGGASAPAGQTAGTNPAQVGLGSRLAGTVQSFAQGALQRTGRPTDLAIQGDGFFIINNGTEQLYTRAGAFNIDGEGRLSTLDGLLVQGWQAGENGQINTNLALGPIEIRAGDLLPPQQTTSIDFGGNLPSAAAIGETSKLSLTTYDDQGEANLLTITLEKTAANEWTATGEYGDPAVPVALTDAVLTFNGLGELVTPADRNINIAAGAIPRMTDAITIELGAAGAPGRLTQYTSDESAGVNSQNGSPSGVLTSFDIGQDGRVTGSYSNGRRGNIGQVAIASFANPAGLERVAGSWRTSPNSGLTQIGTAAAGGRGLISAGTLEMSNVDLAEEFTQLIVAQRGFQGNARMITTSDEVLQEVVNLRR
ncbi:flagellar hook protein FlgE [Ilumatobacter sp.]|uniref:flagellar hook protein FlgE n=1 Tax=Ilumatobacter sp. TaxID=1967498 RepID=UPI003B52B258